MTQNSDTEICSLCRTETKQIFYQDKYRKYFQCPACDLIFVPPKNFLSLKEDKARYDLHQNSPQDQGYRQFLSRLFIPLQELLPPGSYGLDFGSGPGPTLSLMFEAIGHHIEIYDYFYAPNHSLLKKKYDFITASEVVEHLHDPKKELDTLWCSLKTGGVLGIMTKLALDSLSFSRWHYKNDLTHVCFFSKNTFKWLAAFWQAEVTFIDKDVIIFHKK